MVVEIPVFGLVQAAYVDHANGAIGQVGFDGFPALDFRSVSGEENAAREEFVFVGAAGMSEDGIDHVAKKEWTVPSERRTASGKVLSGCVYFCRVVGLPSLGNHSS